MAFGVETVVVLVLAIFIIASNVVVLLVVVKTDTMSLLNRHFFVSLTVADLAVGVLVAPFSVWATVFDQWLYGDRFCQIEACFAAALGVAAVHSLAWLSVDQYVAMRKPDRHATIMTPTRSACWMAVVWATAIGFSVTPLFGDSSTARYYAEAYICAVDWTSQTAYYLTAATLVLVPPLVALSYTNAYIFTARYDRDRAAYDKPLPMNGGTLVDATALVTIASSSSATAAAAAAAASSTFVIVPSVSISSESSRPELYAVTVIVGWVHVATWLPWCALQLYCHFAAAAAAAAAADEDATSGNAYSGIETSFDRIAAGPMYVSLARTRSFGASGSAAVPAIVMSTVAAAVGGSAIGPGSVPMVGPPSLHFWLAWLAIGNSFWKFFVYLLCFHDFRTGLKILYYNYIACR